MDEYFVMKRKSLLVDCWRVLQKDIAEINVLLHTLTGWEHNCGFFGKDK